MPEAPKECIALLGQHNMSVERLMAFLSTCDPDDEVLILRGPDRIGVVKRSDLHFTPEATAARKI